MKKRYLLILVIVLILAVAIIYYLTLLVPFIPGISLTGSQAQENETPFRSPSTSPWQTEETTSGEGEGGGESGRGGMGTGNLSDYTQKINYTLNIDSSPQPFNIRTNYSINNVILNVEDTAPYSVEIESDTIACVLLTSDIPGGSVEWKLDGERCEPLLCLGFLGCSMLMDKPHTVVVYVETPET